MKNSRFCSIADCNKPVYGHGWCLAHYTRWRRHGDPLVRARPANGEAMKYYRDVVLTYDGTACLIWPHSTHNGYGQLMQPDGQPRVVSRLLCEDEHGPPPTPEHEAAHSCGNGRGGCVTRRHVSWKTPLGNAADQVAHGKTTRGERAVNSKLTEADVHNIRSLTGHVSQRELAEQYGINQQHVSEIQTGKKWGWLTAPT